jgi:RecA-family ATPase
MGGRDLDALGDEVGDLMAAPVVSTPAAKADPFDGAWRTVAQWGAEVGEGQGWLGTQPPPRRCLLRRAPKAAKAEDVYPMGKVGMLAAAGAAGKTTALVQLALSVALPQEAHQEARGRFDWLGEYQVATPGRVLLVLGEEDEEEAWRRLHRVAKAYGLAGDYKRWADEASRRLVVVPAAGNSGLSLVRSLGGEADLRTEFARALLERLETEGKAHGDWSLVILDPVSRFAGGDTETDNRAATAFVQVLETLTKAPGKPAVLVAHHTNKTSRGASGPEATDLRGVTGLSDGIRWQAGMTPLKHANLERLPEPEGYKGPALVSFAVTKTNYTKRPPELHLTWSEDGILRRATALEWKAYKETTAKAEAANQPTPRQRKRATPADETEGAGDRKGQRPL